MVNIDVINWSESANVANHGNGDKRLPTRAVFIILTFIVVIESACAAASLTILPLLFFTFIALEPNQLAVNRLCETLKMILNRHQGSTIILRQILARLVFFTKPTKTYFVQINLQKIVSRTYR